MKVGYNFQEILQITFRDTVSKLSQWVCSLSISSVTFDCGVDSDLIPM